MSSPHAWTLLARSLASGANDLLWLVSQASRSNLGAVALLSFPPSVVVQVKALACELPHRLGLPLSRLSLADIRQEAMAQGIVAQVSGSTLWRWLSADALRPWQHRSWIFPRDPDFALKAGRILDLYARIWQGKPLQSSEFVISADEKTSVQARCRKQPTLPGAAGRPMRVEHEYFREDAWTYLAAWDVHRAKLFGHCEKKSGIAPTDRLIAAVMRREPYRSAKRVFWIMDNCSAHRGQKAVERVRSRWPNALLVHTPVHASWINQIDLFLHPSKKGAHSQRFLLALTSPAMPHGFSNPLPTNRFAIPMDFHAQRPLCSSRQTTTPSRRCRGVRKYVTVIPVLST